MTVTEAPPYLRNREKDSRRCNSRTAPISAIGIINTVPSCVIPRSIAFLIVRRLARHAESLNVYECSLDNAFATVHVFLPVKEAGKVKCELSKREI